MDTGGLLICILQSYGEIRQRFSLTVENTGTKVGGTAAVDDGTANDVSAFLERQSF